MFGWKAEIGRERFSVQIEKEKKDFVRLVYWFCVKKSKEEEEESRGGIGSDEGKRKRKYMRVA